MVTRSQFVAAVRGLIGTPVRHQGRIAGRGVDCVGVALVAMAACGRPLSCDTRYGRLPTTGELRAGLSQYCSEVAVDEARPGDLLQVYAGREARHVLVLVGENAAGQRLAVHAWGIGDRVCEVPVSEATRVAAAWRVREVADG